MTTRLVRAPAGKVIQTATGVVRQSSASSGMAPLGPLPSTQEDDEPDSAGHDAWAREIQRREASAGVADAPRGRATPKLREVTQTPAPLPATPPRQITAPRERPDLNGLPEKFVLEIERKDAGHWKITAPAVHLGLYIIDQDLIGALSGAPGALARILRLDGPAPRPKTRKRRPK